MIYEVMIYEVMIYEVMIYEQLTNGTVGSSHGLTRGSKSPFLSPVGQVDSKSLWARTQSFKKAGCSVSCLKMSAETRNRTLTA